MSRPPLRWLGHTVILGFGIGLGLSFGRVAIPLSARAGAGPAALPTAPSAVGPDGVYGELARQYERFREVDRTFEDVARVVAPSVVHIIARKSGEDEDGHVTLFEETGSGLIVRADDSETRYVLTNNHVVEGARAEDLSIHLHDGRVLKPELYWADFKVDIAVLKLGQKDLPAARLGDSDQAAVGSWVLAIGSPFGLTHSVSQGIISARSRFEAELEEDGVENQDFLQTDAAINPGNSGGPLVNLKGEVIGINTAIASNGGGSEGVGFSIPINLARWAMTQLVANGHVSRGAIGVRLDALDATLAQKVGLDRPHGAWIASVQEGSPAASAGLREGDVVLRYNGEEVIDYNHLINLVSMSPIGQTAELVVWRDGKEQGLEIHIADRAAVIARAPSPATRSQPGGLLRRSPRPAPPPVAGADGVPRGLGLIAINEPATARRYGLSDSVRGVLVTQIDPGSPLATILRPFDLIESIAGRVVRSTDEVREAIAAHRGGGPIEVIVLRSDHGSLRRETVRIP